MIPPLLCSIFIISCCYAFMLITDICLHSVCLPMVTNQWLCSRCGFVASNREEGWLVLWAHTEGEVTLTDAPEQIGRLGYRESVWEDHVNLLWPTGTFVGLEAGDPLDGAELRVTLWKWEIIGWKQHRALVQAWQSGKQAWQSGKQAGFQPWLPSLPSTLVQGTTWTTAHGIPAYGSPWDRSKHTRI